MGHCKAVELVLILLHRLIPTFSQVVQDYNSNGILGFAILCKIAEFSVPKTLCETFKYLFLGQG